MKKLSILTSFLMVAILCLAGTSWAGEASVFDDVQKIIIRAFTTCTPGSSCPLDTPTPTYSAYLEVRNPDGDLIPPDKLVVTPLPAGNPLTAEADGTYYKIHDNNLSSPDFSISFDNDDGITYLICTNESVHVMKYEIRTLLPVAGVCGSANGGTFASAPATNLCGFGTATGFTGSGPWNWNCPGTNGGTPASCSANIQAVNGVCGSSNGQTFTSAPATNLCGFGTATGFTGSGPWNWNCPGTNGGTTASCSANIQSSSLSDLIVSSISAPTSLDNNSLFGISVTVRNQGTGSAGPFTVTVYVNTSYVFGGTVLLTWNVDSLAAGQSISKTFSNTVINGLATHVTYYFVVKADSGNIITETDETNNVKYRYFTIAR